jgi:hypothetical protein
MGDETATRTTFKTAADVYVPTHGPATAQEEVRARRTGKLDPLVDPAGLGGIRYSRMRFRERSDGLFEVTVGFPVPVEIFLDTTGSMGDNVDRALKSLPDTHGLASLFLPGCDLQLAIGIFGDVEDPHFVLCRMQFEMLAEKLVRQLMFMVPERGGYGNGKEDPQYGMFAHTYLTSTYAQRIGLKSYCLFISDEPVCEYIEERQLVRIFGDEVFARVRGNGHEINESRLPTTEQIVREMLKRTHAFFLQVGNDSRTTDSWIEHFGRNRVISLPSVELLPQVQSIIIGLTENTLALCDAKKFLLDHDVHAETAEGIVRSVSKIPIGAQADLPNFGKRPKKGDLFRSKTDLWPIDHKELGDEDEEKNNKKGSKGKKATRNKPGGEWL